MANKTFTRKLDLIQLSYAAINYFLMCANYYIGKDFFMSKTIENLLEIYYGRSE